MLVRAVFFPLTGWLTAEPSIKPRAYESDMFVSGAFMTPKTVALRKKKLARIRGDSATRGDDRYPLPTSGRRYPRDSTC